MGKLIDLTGQRFGSLTVMGRAGTYQSLTNKHVIPTWLCKCDCGAITVALGNNLRSGMTTSCGCYQKDVASYNAQMGYSGRKKRKVYVYGYDRA